MTAKIAGLTLYRQKGEPGVSLSEIKLLKDIGIEGDFHQGGERQVSLLSAEVRRWMETQTQKGLCFERFRENMLIDGISLQQLKRGTFLFAGSAVLRISAHSKHCHGECALLSKEMPCRLAKCVCFAAVAQSGIARIGDSVTVCPQDE